MTETCYATLLLHHVVNHPSDTLASPGLPLEVVMVVADLRIMKTMYEAYKRMLVAKDLAKSENQKYEASEARLLDMRSNPFIPFTLERALRETAEAEVVRDRARVDSNETTARVELARRSRPIFHTVIEAYLAELKRQERRDRVGRTARPYVTVGHRRRRTLSSAGREQPDAEMPRVAAKKRRESTTEEEPADLFASDGALELANE